MRSIIYCFGGVCVAASTILAVAIAKFGSYDNNRDVRRMQFAILDRSPREMSQTDRIEGLSNMADYASNCR